MDNTAKVPLPQKLFDRDFVVGETHFLTHHRMPLLRSGGVDRWILNLTIGGHGRINRGHNEIQACRGHLLLFPPGVVHDYGTLGEDDWIHLWCYFEPCPEWLRLLAWPDDAVGVRKLYSADHDFTAKLETIFRKMLAFYQSRLPRYRDFCTNALEELLLWTDLLNPSSPECYDEALNRCRGFMAAHLDRTLQIAELAGYCHMSPSRFAHWFSERQGMAPMRYLELLRMEKSRELLSYTDMNITEIAAAVGYDDPLYFTRVFKKNTGQSPRQFRLSSVEMSVPPVMCSRAVADGGDLAGRHRRC